MGQIVVKHQCQNQRQFYGSTTVEERGQVVIPAEARADLSIEKGEKLLVIKLNDGALMLLKLSSLEKISKVFAAKQKEITKILKGI